MTEGEKYQAILWRHHQLIWRRCWRYSRRDVERTKDLVQEVVLALWSRYGRLRPDAGPLAERRWVDLNTRDVLRCLHRRQDPAPVPLDDDMADRVADERDEARQRVDELLDDLEADERRLVRMNLDGYSAKEIGQALGLSPDAVYQRMHRIIKKLKQINHAE